MSQNNMMSSVDILMVTSIN